MSGIVYAKQSCITHLPGGVPVRLREGDLWDADDPVVKTHPNLFSDEPTRINRTTRTPVVEQATAAPGEKRRRR